MVVVKGLVEAPVLDALFKLSTRPTREDAWGAMGNRDVRSAAFQVAEKMREIAKEEDDARKGVGKKDLNNYRRFYVGAVGVGLILSDKDAAMQYEWFAFAAYNTKPSKKAGKFCAEMRIIRAARELRCCCMGGIAILGENQPDGRSGALRKTLDPCGECRDVMKADCNRFLFTRRTLIATAKPLSQLQYVETLPKVFAAHGEKW